MVLHALCKRARIIIQKGGSKREGKNGERLLRRPGKLSKRPAMLSYAPSLRQNPGAVFLALGQSRLA